MAAEQVTRSCEYCGIFVTKRKSQFKKHTFCTVDCYRKSDLHMRGSGSTQSTKVDTRCDFCGEIFSRNKRLLDKTDLSFCNSTCMQSYATAHATGHVSEKGYVYICVQGKTMLQHRKVMEDFLGRPLLHSEEVHHKNGDRADNRLENLELWSTSQPKGQRIEDKISWAREILDLYEKFDLADSVEGS